MERQRESATKHWSDDETLWQAMAAALDAPARFAAADADAAAVAAVVPLRPGATVLDLGCGAGVHAIAFAARGYIVTGVDRSPSLLSLAREHARARSLEVSFVEGDMREFSRRSTYELVCSFYSSFGYFNDRTNRRVLRNMHVSLRSGGVLVLDVLGRETIDQWWRQRASYQIGGSAYQVERKLWKNQSVLLESWTVITRGVRKRFAVRQRIYGGDEIRAELHRAGFQRVELFGGVDGVTPYGQAVRRLVAYA